MRIWNRSVEKLHLRYTTIISDGDSKTHKLLCDLQPYGPNVKIVKHECVGHVEKRMSTRLRNLKKSRIIGPDGKALKWGGKGRLTNGCIDKLAQYYGNAIRVNTNDLDGMTKACWAVYYHSCSSDSDPQHEFCPTGVSSWCRYNKTIALLQWEDFPPPPSQTCIPADIALYIKP